MTIALNNSIVAVTGAAGGIGRAICKALRDAGAQIVATDITDAADGLDADHYLKHDVTDEDNWRSLETLIREEYGRVDALVNNAGVSVVGSVEATPLSDWRRLNAVNVESIVIGTQVMLPLLKEAGKSRKGGASIVNFSSIGGMRGAAFQSAYCTSKGAVRILSKSMAVEFGMLGYNVRVNSVHPGGVETPMLQSILDTYVDLGAAPSADVAREGVISKHPIGRMGQPEEIAGGVVYLCSEAASFVTGTEFVIDGGYTAA